MSGVHCGTEVIVVGHFANRKGKFAVGHNCVLDNVLCNEQRARQSVLSEMPVWLIFKKDCLDHFVPLCHSRYKVIVSKSGKLHMS